MSEVKRILKNIKELWEKLDRSKQIALLAMVSIVIIAFFALGSITKESGKVILYNDLNAADYGNITKSLQAMGYEWSGNETDVIYVSSRDRQAIITQLAQDNMIPNGVEGYEIFDMSRWDETTFDKNIKLHRAIKGSLEQMLMTLDFIKRAKVDLAIPTQNNFLTNIDPVKASVVIVLKPGVDKISSKQVTGIKNLVYRSVPRLQPENITLTDDNGYEFTEDDKYTAQEKELDIAMRKKKFEERERKLWHKELEERLTAYYPADRISILRVSLNINWDQVTEKQNLVSPVEAQEQDPEVPYNTRKLMPNGSLIVSQNKRNEQFKGRGFTPGGPSGTSEQLPPGYRDLDYQRSEYGNDDTITNYAFNTAERNIVHQPWEERARSIAVALDGTWKITGETQTAAGQWAYQREYVPPSQEELTTLRELLKASLLYKGSRGDLIVVKHLQKDRALEFLTEDRSLNYKKMRDTYLRFGVILFSSLLGIFILWRSILSLINYRKRKIEDAILARQEAMAQAVKNADTEGKEQVEISPEVQMREEMFGRAAKLAKEKPEEAARLLRSWLME